jgi:hypothetical protein
MYEFEFKFYPDPTRKPYFEVIFQPRTQGLSPPEYEGNWPGNEIVTFQATTFSYYVI